MPAFFRQTGIRFVFSVLLSGALASWISAEPRSSLSDLDSDKVEVPSGLPKILQENVRLKTQVRALQERLTLGETAGAKLAESVAIANSEAEVFRRQSGELKLRLEALGVDGGPGSTGKIEQRLLSATSDLRLAEQQRTTLRDGFQSLLSVVQTVLSAPAGSESESRVILETQVKKSIAALEASGSLPAATSATLTDGQVISVSDELSLVVANLGTRQGIVSGMPFQVFREGRLIGTIRVVDARERIAGAIIENLSSEKERIRAGDRVKVAARQ